MKKSVGKKIFKFGLLVSISICFLAVFFFFMFYINAPVNFDKTKITDSNLSIHLYDNSNRPLKHTYLNSEYVSLKQIPLNTQKCFISIEDKNFFNHNGINYKRILGAMLKNITQFKFVEGASTISQQLIKNTHLTSEKTIKRKINEIKLTRQLENAFTKNEILESYLNIIYFGDNCYGIENASQHYFSKNVSKLTLDESALLAGIIKSPNRYHPVSQYDMCIERRNTVLKEMYEDGNISFNEYKNTLNTHTNIKISNINKVNKSYQKACIKEAENILQMPEKQIAIGGYRIYTYYNEEKQKALQNSIDTNIQEDCSMISINVKDAAIEAYTEKSNLSLINVKRQPASAIKPLLVYAPAINENIISPSTQILDQNVSINGYEPKNISGKEYGYVDAKFALSQSLNIPAVKILSYVGLEKAKRYIQEQNIEFDNTDNSLALALGGMTYGVSLKELTNCYQTLANNGNYINAKFINYIVDSTGKVVYKNTSIQKNIFREDTSYLITDMLHEVSKTGTAKRLSDLDYYVASKTGTSSISQKNLDAYNISYTSQDVVGCWIGNLDNSPTDIVGGGKPTLFVKNYLNQIYKNNKPKIFDLPSGIIELDIDLNALENEHIVYKANNLLPERYRKKALFSRFNQPTMNYTDTITLNSPKITGKVINGIAEISFLGNVYYEYELYMIDNNEQILIDKIANKNGIHTFKILQKPNKICKYFIKAKAKNYINGDILESEKSNEIELYYRQ